MLVAGKWVLRVHHHSVWRRIVRNHRLLLDHRSLPIELVECSLEGLRYTRASEDLVRTELEHQQVIEVQMKLVCSESQARRVESNSCFGQGPSIEHIVRFRLDCSARNGLLDSAHVGCQM